MPTTDDKIREIEAEIARTQKNKATEGHLGMLKAKLCKLKKELLTQGSGGGGGGGEGFDVRSTGDARVGLVGFPSVGKSTLMSRLTGVESEAAAYEFTTLTCIPGTFRHNGCDIQLLDLPGIIEGANDGKGRGRQVIGVARTCHLILICLDVTSPMGHKRIIEGELEGFGIRLNKKPPKISIRKLQKGPVSVIKTVPQTQIDDATIRSLCREFRYNSCEVILRCDASVEDVIDALDGNRAYIPCIYVLNKIDAISIEELDVLARIPNCVPICGRLGWNLEELKEMIWEKMDMIRVYTKPRGQIPDYDSPVVLPRSHSTVEDFCRNIHKALVEQLNYAWVWGSSVKHNPQKVGKDHQLKDEDIVQIVKK